MSQRGKPILLQKPDLPEAETWVMFDLESPSVELSRMSSGLYRGPLPTGFRSYGRALRLGTFPQLYVKGELLGGCDIVEEMLESGELADLLGVEQPAEVPTGAAEKGAATADGSQQSPPMQIET